MTGQLAEAAEREAFAAAYGPAWWAAVRARNRAEALRYAAERHLAYRPGVSPV